MSEFETCFVTGSISVLMALRGATCAQQGWYVTPPTISLQSFMDHSVVSIVLRASRVYSQVLSALIRRTDIGII